MQLARLTSDGTAALGDGWGPHPPVHLILEQHRFELLGPIDSLYQLNPQLYLDVSSFSTNALFLFQDPIKGAT